MPQVNCATGQGGENLSVNQAFDWINWNALPCTVSDCSDWCNMDSYTVPAASGGVPGSHSAHTRPGISPGDYDFTSGCSTVPGQPHVTIKG
jgi:hypothetical protein